MYPEGAGVFRVHGRRLELHVGREEAGRVIDGYLTAGDEWFPIIEGVPCFLAGDLRPDFSDFARRHGLADPVATRRRTPDRQDATAATFSYKWQTFPTYGDRPQEQEFLFDWYCKKLGLSGGIAELRRFYGRFGRGLEVGAGSGFNTRFIAENCPGEVFALDISAAAFTAFAKVKQLRNTTVVQADLDDAPFPDECFDLVIADGVLHHTPSTEIALRNL